jgi:hypothetical protein
MSDAGSTVCFDLREPLTRYQVPTSYGIDPQRRLVISRAWGVLSDADLHEHYAQISADPAFDPAYRQFADLREVTELAVSAAAVEIAAKVPVFSPGARRAFVAPADLHFGMARMFGIYAEDSGQVVQVFRDAHAAEAWLGL